MDIWKTIAGIAIFLLGMRLLEDALRLLAGRSFKLFLRRQTAHKLKAITGGAVVTAILQSSSIVNLMVLAFVGAGVIQMQNALAVILGANLGTTLTSWMVATLGFSFDIESFALPLTGIAGLLMMVTGSMSNTGGSNGKGRWYLWSKLLFGFGFLFVGLDYMKTGIEQAVHKVDLSAFNQYPVIVFLVAGLLIASLIQSSSATVAITLSALYANAITLPAAMAVVLGSETGTSLKLVLASVKGIAAKKRVALGNLLFNGITTVAVFLLLTPVSRLITETVGIKDNLIALVFFQSFINIGGIILFYPFLKVFGRFLEKRFQGVATETMFIHQVPITDTDLAMEALEKETKFFIYRVAWFTLHAFNKYPAIAGKLLLRKEFMEKPVMDQYEYLKRLHGEIHAYFIRLQNSTTVKENTVRLEQLIAVARNAMYTAKSLKDAYNDAEQLRNSSNSVKYDFFCRTQVRVAEFYDRLLTILDSGQEILYFEELAALYQSVQDGYIQTLEQLYRQGITENLDDIEFSTLVNFNREMYTSFKSAVFSAKDLLLNEEKANYFDELPGFIR